MKKNLMSRILAIVFCLIAAKTIASDVTEITSLTDSILIVHFDDGKIEYGNAGAADVVHQKKLDVNKAVWTSSYRIVSSDDINYQEYTYPVTVGRKSKPMETSGVCNWVQGSDGIYLCDNEVVMEHWVYLILPKALQPGNEYTIWLGGLAENMQEITFTFDESMIRSEAVHVNTVGFVPGAPVKYGYVGHWMGDLGSLSLEDYAGNDCYLVDITNPANKFQVGDLTLRRSLSDSKKDANDLNRWGDFNNFYGGDVYEVDFSSFTTPGEYVLMVEGIGCSYPFKIAEDAYTAPFYHTIRGLYHQRAGIELKEPYTQWTRGRDHHPDDGRKIMYTTVKSNLMGENKDLHNATVAGATEELYTWGWYHDAGDWDGYIHHAKVPFYLFSLYELNPALFGDNELNIPQFQNGEELTPGIGNGIPDILDEASWLVEYYRRNIRPNGGVCGGRVHGNMNSKPSNVTSAGDTRIFYAGAEDPHTTFLFAGLAATYAWTLEIAGVTDSSYALIQEAKNAYTWASANIMSEDLSIEVDGMDVYDIKMYAAVCLFKYTGEQEYYDDLVNLNRVTSPTASLSGSDYKQNWPVWIYTTIPDDSLTISGSLDLKNQFVSAVIKHGDDQFVDYAKNKSSRISMNPYVPPVIGYTTTPDVINGLFAYNVADTEKKSEILGYVHATSDYFLGGNPLNITWITGFGDFHPTRMLHLDSHYDNKDEMVPGLVPYGPTQRDTWGKGSTGPFDADFTKIRSYPDMYDWPISEMFYNTRYSVMDGEFTIHQNNNQAVMAYGFLSAEIASFQPNDNPLITISGISDNEIFNESDTVKINVAVSDDEWVRKVEFYLDHHKIGEVTGPDFSVMLPAQKLMTGDFELTAVAVDNEGAKGTSEAINVSIQKDYLFDFITPLPNDTVSQGVFIDVLPDIDFQDVTIDKVEYYMNGELVFTTTEIPYSAAVQTMARDNEVLVRCYFTEGFITEATIRIYAHPSVSGVEINPSSLELFANEYYQLTYSVLPADAKNLNVSWRSSNTEICTIDETGLITALASGSAQIIVETEEGAFQAICNVNVKPARQVGPWSGIPTIIPGKIEAENYDIGGEGYAYHDAIPGNQKEAYRNDGVDIEQTYDGGTAYSITNVEPGEWMNYTIYVSEDNFYDVTFRITAGLDGAKVKLLLDDNDLTGSVTLPKVGWYPLKDFTLEDVYFEEGRHVLTFYVENGPFTINYMNITCSACTTEVAEGFSLDESSLTISRGSTQSIGYQFVPQSVEDNTIFWKSLNDLIAFVDQSGNVTGVSVGNTKIVAITKQVGYSDTIDINVISGNSIGVTAMNFEIDNLQIHQGDKELINPVFTPSDATDKKVIFSSSNPAVAKVDEFGYVLGLSTGQATIYGTTRDGYFKDNIIVTVINELPVVSITSPLDKATFKLNESVEVNADITDDSRVVRFEVYVNDLLKGYVLKSPWQVVLTGLSSGYHTITVKAFDDDGAVTFAGPVRVFLDTPVSIHNLEEDNISVFPNPAENILMFRFNSFETVDRIINVYSLDGQLVLTHHMPGSSPSLDSEKIDISMLNNGMYIYRIGLDAHMVISGTFVKK